MTQLMDFDDLYEEWEVTFERIQKGGGYYDEDNGGKWVAGYLPPVEMNGIIAPLSYADLQFDPGGTYTREDRKIYVRQPGELQINDRIRSKGKEYRVLEQRDYSEYAGMDIYIGKRVDTKGRDPVA